MVTPKAKQTTEQLKRVGELVGQVQAEFQPALLERLIRQVEGEISENQQVEQVKAKLKQNVSDESVLGMAENLRRAVQKSEDMHDYIQELYIYIQDPLVAKKDKTLGIHPLNVVREPGLGAGPSSARLVVFDFDIDQGVVHPPAAWNENQRRFESADGKPLDPNSGETKAFHQVNAWAVVQFLLDLCEGPEVFGRLLPWGFAGNRLIIVPHAGLLPNAFYDRGSKSLQFYYLGDPQKTVYNCLSFDVVAHEAGHAILDGIRPYYFEFSSLQTAAFHEFFADMSAMLGCLRNNVLRRKEAQDTGGNLKVDSVIRNLAEQFGDEVYQTPGLRDLASAKKMSDIKASSIPHDCSLVLTGAIFELLQKIAENYKLSPLEKLWKATRRILPMALAPVDFLPPVDVQFIDYAQAVLRRLQTEPSEKKSANYAIYEQLVRDVFAKRGLDLSNLPPCPELTYGPQGEAYAWSRTSLYHFLHAHRAVLHIPPCQDFQVLEIYQTIRNDRDQKKLPPHYVVQYLWGEEVSLNEERFGPLQGQTAELLCGGTLVFNAEGQLISWMYKPGCDFPADQAAGEARKQALREHIAAQVAAGRVGLQPDREVQINGPWTPPVVASTRNDRLHLEITPAVQKKLDQKNSALLFDGFAIE